METVDLLKYGAIGVGGYIIYQKVTGEDVSIPSYAALTSLSAAYVVLKNREKAKALKEDYSKSYERSCYTFKITNPKDFKKFNENLIRDTYKSFELPYSKILNFQNYVIGFCNRYLKGIFTNGNQLIIYGEPSNCSYDLDNIEYINYKNKVKYYILCADAIRGLKKYVDPNEFEKIAPLYYGILLDKLDFENIEQENEAIYLYSIYKQTGVINPPDPPKPQP